MFCWKSHGRSLRLGILKSSIANSLSAMAMGLLFCLSAHLMNWHRLEQTINAVMGEAKDRQGLNNGSSI
jgi:hypothetical protein